MPSLAWRVNYAHRQLAIELRLQANGHEAIHNRTAFLHIIRLKSIDALFRAGHSLVAEKLFVTPWNILQNQVCGFETGPCARG
jgi:hypothetical protein